MLRGWGNFFILPEIELEGKGKGNEGRPAHNRELEKDTRESMCTPTATFAAYAAVGADADTTAIIWLVVYVLGGIFVLFIVFVVFIGVCAGGVVGVGTVFAAWLVFGGALVFLAVGAVITSRFYLR